MNSCAEHTQLHGSVRKQRKVSRFTLTEREYEPNFRIPEHSHENALFCLVLRGGYRERYGVRSRVCHPATALFHASEDPHSESFFDSGGASLIVEIENGWMDEIRDVIDFPRISADFDAGPVPRLASKLYREFRNDDFASSTIIEGLML